MVSPAAAIWLAAGLVTLALPTGCKTPAGGPEPKVSVSPIQSPGPGKTPTPGWSPPATPLDGVYSDQGYAVFGGNLAAEVRSNGQAVKGALVKAYGPTLATTPTNAQGQASFGPLVPGTDYRLVVEAPGYATFVSQDLEVRKKASTSERVELRPEAVIQGRVEAGGKPVVGAVVSDGVNSTLTGTDGRYELRGVAAGPVTLTASKPRFRVASRPVTATTGAPASADLTLAAGAGTIFFDGSVAPGVADARLGTLRKHLADRGWRIEGQPPGADGVWVLVSPAKDLTDKERERLTTFVAQGGKLVVFGEWGGSGGFRTPAANALVHRFGLHFNPDLIREPGSSKDPAWLEVVRFNPAHAAVLDIQSLQLYQGCSLFGLLPMAQLAQTGNTGYRVQAAPEAASQTVAAGGPYKGGKAVILGDASGFTDDDTDGDGVSNAAEAENLAFVERIFDW